MKYLDNIAEEDITKLEIPTGIPLVYRLDKDLKPIMSDRASGESICLSVCGMSVFV